MTLAKQRITEALISLCGCPGWSAPLLFATPQRQVFSRQGPYTIRNLMIQNKDTNSLLAPNRRLIIFSIQQYFFYYFNLF